MLTFDVNCIKSIEYAIKVAKSILYETLKEIEEVTDNQQKDIILICQMIKDNLSLWKNEMSEELINL